MKENEEVLEARISLAKISALKGVTLSALVNSIKEDMIAAGADVSSEPVESFFELLDSAIGGE